MADIANPDLFVCGCRTWICLDITRFYEVRRQPSSGSAWPAPPKTVNRAPSNGGGRCRHNLHCYFNRCDSSTACRLCRLEPLLSYQHRFCMKHKETILKFSLINFNSRIAHECYIPYCIQYILILGPQSITWSILPTYKVSKLPTCLQGLKTSSNDLMY